MERIPLKDLSRDELIGLIERLWDRLDSAERQDAELMKRLEDQARRIEELEKRHPTVRLDKSYSMKAEEQRQAAAAGKKHKQKSARRGRISTAEKLAQARREQRGQESKGAGLVDKRKIKWSSAWMARSPRADEGGGLYHALNRGNSRSEIFPNPDCAPSPPIGAIVFAGGGQLAADLPVQTWGR